MHIALPRETDRNEARVQLMPIDLSGFSVLVESDGNACTRAQHPPRNTSVVTVAVNNKETMESRALYI